MVTLHAVLLEFFCCVSVCLLEMGDIWRRSSSRKSVVKVLLLNNGISENVHPLVASRNEKGEFSLLFNDLLDQPHKFEDYFRINTETFLTY